MGRAPRWDRPLLLHAAVAQHTLSMIVPSLFIGGQVIQFAGDDDTHQLVGQELHPTDTQQQLMYFAPGGKLLMHFLYTCASVF